jgi:hypothetical protein
MYGKPSPKFEPGVIFGTSGFLFTLRPPTSGLCLRKLAGLDSDVCDVIPAAGAGRKHSAVNNG